ncbi:2-amino-4-hydroxy-6-hydroxymethyldihydropteridinediphosphokinase [Paenisporosarcina quisquiliarum]|uniref:2-amino-4-hydroxy-6-hydroxymethyldihydropteridine diphosphokinase n=2 Tax=Psychrobacillus psychrodurans TaxID=126157 RepID=A0A9X3LCC1_9BACI|nr:2-amino-4-hydroxy-6-hydroxymethyldihydropteridine diphosphokinase [Psychrobacillus psychrodurans]MCZ8535333.1 2-amino-4-hydroxy-6-hydroxymethyldihydropteridine diphosphokinase [Psychrobacillus psychrodurans]SEN96254.1 2-amino-4-hydroxy-6-hydroxymethyldihydropteridinediphosphokinase [Paenisporosarcina quisquiliarum]
MMNTVFISLGSNIGNRFGYLQQAVGLLQQVEQVNVVNVSSVYETDPVGYEEQAAFLNMVVEIETLLTPHEILKKCNEIEAGLGRTREIHWGPRTVDLDILLYNEENMKTADLIIPHPRMMERGFVLIPLVELQANLVDPQSKRLISDVAHVQKEGVHLWKTFDGVGAFVHFAG